MSISRRDVLLTTAAMGVAGVARVARSSAETLTATPSGQRSRDQVPISLNTATLRGHKLPVAEVIEIAAKAGFDGIEPWVSELDQHVQSGGKLSDLRKRLEDHGLAVTGAVAFSEWIVDDDARRAKGLEDAKRRMQQVAEIGGTHIAAPPAGSDAAIDLIKAAERYRELLELGETFGLVPALEIWGFARNLFRLGQAVGVALEAQHPKACVLPDVYHLYKGGSGLSGVGRLNAGLLAGFHFNDYPSDPPREAIADKDRVYPGDGVAPLAGLVRDLRAIGYRGPVSVELFNPQYARQDPLQVARTAFEKTRRVLVGEA